MMKTSVVTFEANKMVFTILNLRVQDTQQRVALPLHEPQWLLHSHSLSRRWENFSIGQPLDLSCSEHSKFLLPGDNPLLDYSTAELHPLQTNRLSMRI
jgi:hypothetical protein